MMTLVDRALDGAARVLRMCGHGRDHNWSVRIADAFFVDCACCLFWRGVALGGSIAAALTLTGLAAWSLLAHDPAPRSPPAAPLAATRELAAGLEALAARLDALEHSHAEVRTVLGGLNGQLAHISDGLAGLDARLLAQAATASRAPGNTRAHIKGKK